MCKPMACSDCGKTTWTGCGMHVDQVMSRVPAAQQCTCRPGTTAPAAPARKTNRLLALLRR